MGPYDGVLRGIHDTYMYMLLTPVMHLITGDGVVQTSKLLSLTSGTLSWLFAV